MTIYLPTVAATEHFGSLLFAAKKDFKIVFLVGELGVGKTTLVRGFLRAAGWQGAVKSPTFTLVEEYKVAGIKIIHFDLYRLSNPEELAWIGLSDYLEQDTLCFIEWPEMGEGYLPKPDVKLLLAGNAQGHALTILKAPEDSNNLLWL